MSAPCDPAASVGLVFPDPRDVVAADARRFRALPPRERWREIFALRAYGARQTWASPRRAAIEQLEEAEEARGRAVLRELIEHHAP